MKKLLILSLLILSTSPFLIAQSLWDSTGTNIYYTGGKVGIGTSTPVTEFDVRGKIRLQDTSTDKSLVWRFDALYNSTHTNVHRFRVSGSGASIFFTRYDSHDWIRLLDNKNVLINPNGVGNIGIGTTSPSRLLHVNGSTTDVVSAFESTDSGTQVVLTDNSGSLRLGTLSNGAFALSVGGDASSTTGANVSEAMRVTSAGDVGIGTTTPETNLHIGRSGEDLDLMLRSDNTFNSTLRLSEIQTQQGGYVKNQGDGNLFHIGVSYSSADSDIITIPYSGSNSGNVGIGTTTPGNKLEVNGTARAKEVIVEATGWPDYVFSPEYKLLSLEEIEAHIKAKGHLPEVPSAQEVEEEGQHLGEMQQLLLKKIEEMTLLMIQQEKRIAELEKQLEKSTEEN